MNVQRRLLTAPERSAGILDAAADVFAEAGFAATTIDEIASRAGITKLIVYRHFDSKRDLYLAVLDRLSARLAADPLAPPSPDPDDRELFEIAVARLASYLRAVRDQPTAFRLLVRQAVNDPEFAEHARAILGRGVPAAEDRLGTIEDPTRRHWAAMTIASSVDEAVLAWLEANQNSAVGDQMGIDDTALRITRIIAAIGQSAQ